MSTLPKLERLHGSTAVENLMSLGKWGSVGHIRYCYLFNQNSDINRIMVSAPKKYFKRAVKRNLLKRRLREAYRLQKDILSTKGVDLLFSYSNSQIVDFATIKSEVAAILDKVSKKLDN